MVVFSNTKQTAATIWTTIQLNSLQKPLIKNFDFLCTVGNKSSFVSETSKRSRFGLISEHKKSKFFRIELMFSCAIMGWFRFFSFILVRAFKFLFSSWSFIYWGGYCRIKQWRMFRFIIVIIYDTWTPSYFSKTF